jgi:hypothetical protein
VPTRQTLLSATTNTFPILQLLSARCSFGFDMQVSEAVLYVPRASQMPSTTWAASHAYSAAQVVKPTTRNGHLYQVIVAGTSGGSQPTFPTTAGGTVTDGGVTWQEFGIDIVYDDNVVLTMGAGTNNVVRFNGLFRRFDYSLYPRMVGLVCFGHLVRAQQYENNDEGVGSPGGLDINDLAGAAATDATIVRAVLDHVPQLSYTAGNIGGTSTAWGTQITTLSPSPFLWRNGQNPSIKVDIGGKGETALEYIQRIDAVSAIYTNSTSAAGFYRLYEQVGGTIRRALLGSRPRNTADFTFTEGVDIEQGSSSREFPLANRVYVQGFDYGKIGGPVNNLASSTIQSSNPFMPSTEKHTYTFSSPLIERGLDADAGSGMSCEKIANALMLDVNRETVRCTFTTPLDYLIGPGSTVLAQAAGGIPDRLGIGENLWVTHNDISVGEDGHFSQQLQCLGGGLPDNYTSAPPI